MPGRSSLSLERKLPLLISVLLVLLALGLTWASYEEVRQAAQLRGIDRLQRLTAQLAELVGTSAEQRLARLQLVAADSAVVAHLANGAADPSSATAAIAALGQLATSPADTPVVAELRGVREARRIATHPELDRDTEPAAALVKILSHGQPALGDLYHRGDSVYFWAGAPVTAHGRVFGYVLQRRVLRTQARLERQLRGLAGTDNVSIYFASDSGEVWARLSGAAVAPPAMSRSDEAAPNVIRYTRANDTAYVAVYARVANTPLRVLAEMPYTALLERPATYLRRSIIVALAMLVIGGLAAWALSRHITRPLRDLTLAAEAMSTGDYAQRARVARRDETGRLADAFNTMAEQVQGSHRDLQQTIDESRLLAARLEEANRAKADFLATMSHELRTPLNAIGGYVDLLELGVRGPVTAEQRHDLGRVRYNQRHLLTLIGNILDFARLDARKMSYDVGDVRVDHAVTEILAAIAPLLDEKGLHRECVGCDEPVLARADRGRLEQILLNLLSNAVRFTPAGGAVTVTLEQHDERIAVVVSDTGIGIPDEKLTAIFDPFVQLSSGLTRTVGGTGLGLTISRDLARGMSGDLTAANVPGGGARFTLTLPAVTAEADLVGGGLVGGRAEAG